MNIQYIAQLATYESFFFDLNISFCDEIKRGAREKLENSQLAEFQKKKTHTYIDRHNEYQKKKSINRLCPTTRSIFFSLNGNTQKLYNFYQTDLSTK